MTKRKVKPMTAKEAMQAIDSPPPCDCPICAFAKMTLAQKRAMLKDSEKKTDAEYGPEWKVKITKASGKKVINWVRAHSEIEAYKNARASKFMLDNGLILSPNDKITVERHGPEEKKAAEKRRKAEAKKRTEKKAAKEAMQQPLTANIASK